MSERREWCIGEREVGRLFNVTIYERVMRSERRRGDAYNCDYPMCFALRAGEQQGPRLDHYLAHQAVAGDSEALLTLGRIIWEFYDRRRAE